MSSSKSFKNFSFLLSTTFCLFLFCNCQVIVQQNDHGTYINDTADVISSPRIRDSRGLKNIALANSLVSQGKLSEALSLAYGEKDINIILQWLTQKTAEGHTIFMLELSKLLAELGRNEQAAIWLQAGIFRAYQDAMCCADPSVIEAINVIMYRYLPILGIKKKQEYLIILKKSVPKAIEIIENMTTFPNPKWISYHGISNYSRILSGSSEEPLLKPESEWPIIRRNLLLEFKHSFEDQFPQ